MAKTAKKNKKKSPKQTWRQRQVKRLRRGLTLGGTAFLAIFILMILLFALINPPTTVTMISEKQRLGRIDRQWVALEEVAPVMLRSVVAAEDANYCHHWGFDVTAIRAAIEDGASRGASTISQQVVKNVYLWQGRSWLRKALETSITPFVEIIWSKQRILEVYLNVAEFDEGVFGVEAAARHYFGVGPEELTANQSARLASVLPNPKARSANQLSASQARRVASIVDGAATIQNDGRAACFQ